MIRFLLRSVIVADGLPRDWFQRATTMLQDLKNDSPDTKESVHIVKSGLVNRGCRQCLCLVLLKESEDPEKCKVNVRVWNTLVDFFKTMLTIDPKDYGVCQLCLDASERFYLASAESCFLTEQLSSLELWKDMRLWQFIFSARLHQSLRKVYSSDIVEKWDTRTPKEIKDFAIGDWANMKTQIITISSRMARLSLGSEFVADFIMRICAMSGTDPAEEQNLVRLANALPQHRGFLQEKDMIPPELRSAKMIILWVDQNPKSPESIKALLSFEKAVRKADPTGRVVPLSSLESFDQWLQKYSPFVHKKLRIIQNHTRKPSFGGFGLSSLLSIVREKYGYDDVPIIELLTRRTLSLRQVTTLPADVPNVMFFSSVDDAVEFCSEKSAKD